MSDLEEMPPFKIGEWGWYAKGNSELFTEGPEDTREGIISVATDAHLGECEPTPGEWKLSFTIARCQKKYIDIAGYFDVTYFLERIDEDLYDELSSECDESSPLEAIKTVAAKELQILVRNAIREWQKRHGYVMAVNTFECIADEEEITIDHPSDY